MEKKLKALALALLLIFAPLAPVVRAQSQPADVEKTAKIKSEIARRVRNEKTSVKIKLRDGAELKARITQAGESSFTATDEKTGKQTELAYSDVAKVKGRGMSTGLKIGIIAGAALATVAVLVIIALRDFDIGPITVR